MSHLITLDLKRLIWNLMFLIEIIVIVDKKIRLFSKCSKTIITFKFSIYHCNLFGLFQAKFYDNLKGPLAQQPKTMVEFGDSIFFLL